MPLSGESGGVDEDEEESVISETVASSEDDFRADTPSNKTPVLGGSADVTPLSPFRRNLSMRPSSAGHPAHGRSFPAQITFSPPTPGTVHMYHVIVTPTTN